MSELYYAMTPAVVPPDLLAVNPSLLPNKTTYFLLGGGGATKFNAKVTQDYGLATSWSAAIQSSSILLAWAQALQWYYDALTPLVAPSGGVGGAVPTPAQNAAAVVSALAPSFDAIPTATENGTAARVAIVK